MKQSLAASSPRVWNQKNLPSSIDWRDESSAAQKIRKVPAAVAGFVRQRPSVLWISVAAAIALVGLLWYATRED